MIISLFYLQTNLLAPKTTIDNCIVKETDLQVYTKVTAAVIEVTVAVTAATVAAIAAQAAATTATAEDQAVILHTGKFNRLILIKKR